MQESKDFIAHSSSLPLLCVIRAPEPELACLHVCVGGVWPLQTP